MTTFEQKRAFEILNKKFKDQGQRITNHQSGWIEEFGAGEGRLPRQGVEEQFPQGDERSIAEAISYVQRISEQYPDDFAKWAAGSNVLNKVDGGSARQAKVNRSGQTSDPINYPYNAGSSTAGPGKSVLTSELSNDEKLKQLVASAEDLFQQHRMAEGHLKAKILHVSKL